MSKQQPLDRERVEALLSARLASVEEEIRHYPAPIPACDAQFNYLLEQRSQIPQLIARLRDVMQQPVSMPQRQQALAAFVSACPFIDAAALSREPVAG